MRFLSICSGIEAASQATKELGWEALAFAEIEPFPCRLLAYHYPNVPNLGDLNGWRKWAAELLAQADVLCGGTPCQAFSVAGLRGSLNDERGNLTLTFCHLYDEIDRQRHLCGRPPAVCLWENVPGVLNTDDNAFGCFLSGLAGDAEPLEPGPRPAPGRSTVVWAWDKKKRCHRARWPECGVVSGPRRTVAWRKLDAQFFQLAQRRDRVFVVASADPAFDPAAVLFELDGLRRDTPPRRGAGEGAAPTLSARTKGGGGLGTDAECDGAVIPEQFSVLSSQFSVAKSIAARPHASLRDDSDNYVPEVIPLAFGGNNTAGPIPTIPTIPALNANRGCHNPGDFEAGALLVERAESGERRAECFAFPERLSGTQCASEAGLSPVLQSRNPTAVAYPQQDKEKRSGGEEESFAFDLRGREGGAMPEGPHATANLRAGSGGSSRSYVAQKAENGGRRAESPEAFAFHENQRGELTVNDTAGSLKVAGGKPGQGYAAVAFQEPAAFTLHGSREGTQAVASPTDTAGTIREGTGTAIQNSSTTVALDQPRTENREPGTAWRVRRLTPEECEILQGFPVGYTLIPVEAPMQSRTKAKPRKGRRKGEDLSDTMDYLMSLGLPRAEAEVLAHSPDGPRYKALGNSWAVPVARWIARRIDAHLTRQTSNPSTP